MDENSLIKKAVTGDKKAFAKLYTLYKDRLYRYAYFKLGNDSDAQDAVSACITAAYENIVGLKSEKAFQAWIFKILYRCCCELVKNQIAENSREALEELNKLPVSENGYIAAELKEALYQLCPDDREIVLLSAVAGYNSREISKITGLKSSTVRSRLSRGLAKMKEFLE